MEASDINQFMGEEARVVELGGLLERAGRQGRTMAGPSGLSRHLCRLLDWLEDLFFQFRCRYGEACQSRQSQITLR